MLDVRRRRPRPDHDDAPSTAADDGARWPHRRALLAGETVVTVAGLAGSVMLLAGWSTPPLETIAPLGLTSWTVPALWLAATVPVPAAAAAALAWRRSPHAPVVAIAAGATLAVEVVVQIPFLGPNPLQAVFGGAAVGLALLADRARRRGWGTDAGRTGWGAAAPPDR